MSEKITAAEASNLHNEGMLNVTDYLYVLRNDAGQAADELMEAINYVRERIDKAQRTHDRLMFLANRAERAAEREHKEGRHND